MRKYFGVPPIEAISLRLTARAFLPNWKGSIQDLIEMDALNKDIGGDEQGLRPHLDDSDIITDSLNQGRIRRGCPFSDSVDESELTNLPEDPFPVTFNYSELPACRRQALNLLSS